MGKWKSGNTHNHYKGAQELRECLLRYTALQGQPLHEALLGAVLLRRHLGVSARGTLCTKVCLLCSLLSLYSLFSGYFFSVAFLSFFFFQEMRKEMLRWLCCLTRDGPRSRRDLCVTQFQPSDDLFSPLQEALSHFQLRRQAWEGRRGCEESCWEEPSGRIKHVSWQIFMAYCCVPSTACSESTGRSCLSQGWVWRRPT